MGLFSAYLDFKEIFPWKGRFPKLSRKRFEIKVFSNYSMLGEFCV